MSMSLIAGMAIVLAVVASTRLVTSRRVDRSFEIVASRRRRGSGASLLVLGLGLCAMALFAGYRWLPAGLPAQAAAQAEPGPTLRLAESFDSYREMQQNAQQTR